MISVEQALEKILSYVAVLEEEPVPILDSPGQVLAEDIYSSINVPPLDNAAMDGYAVQSGDTYDAGSESPRFLRVIDTVIAGAISECEVEAGTAIRIMTGAPVPKGADSVVRFEDTDEVQRKKSATEQSTTTIGILGKVKAGLNIRRAGEDISSGAMVLKKGVVIRPAEVGVLASLGRSKVAVTRRPVVAILATGNELVEINQPLAAGKIYNSNTYSVAALVRRYGGIPKILGIALDNEDSLVTKLRQGLDADMLITTGGVSAGDYDIVKDVLAKEGEITFWTVRMKPGKPLAFGTIKGTGKKGVPRSIPHLGLPGNPVSSMVTFELFARPAILKMMGKKNLAKPTVKAVIAEPIVNTGGRKIYTRAVVEKHNGQYFARLTGPQGSGILTSMSQGNGLVIVPEDKAEVKAGEVVQVMMLDWNEEVNLRKFGRQLIISIVGKSKSGKTTLLEGLITELKQRGYKVAAIKHAGADFELDEVSKDSWRFSRAGSEVSAVSSAHKLAVIKNLEHDLSPEEISHFIRGDYDLMLTEGFKQSSHPKIEVHRKEQGKELLSPPRQLLAVVTDEPLEVAVPQFPRDEVPEIVDLIEKTLLAQRKQDDSCVSP